MGENRQKRNRKVAIWYDNHRKKDDIIRKLGNYLATNHGSKIKSFSNNANRSYIEFTNGNIIEFVYLSPRNKGKRFDMIYVADFCRITIDEYDEIQSMMLNSLIPNESEKAGIRVLATENIVEMLNSIDCSIWEEVNNCEP